MAKKTKKEDTFYVAGIGSSAGGLEALTKLLSALPKEDVPLSIVVAQHLSPSHKSHMVQLLSKNSTWEVVEASHNTTVQANKVYITPPDRDIVLKSGQIRLSRPSSEIGPKPSVNVLLESLAAEYGPQAIGVILSGTGRDGAEGVIEIKEAGGVIFVQDPKTAAYDGMPVSALETKRVDLSLKAEEIGAKLIAVVKDEFKKELLDLEDEGQKMASELDKIFDLLQKKTGVDFSDYKMSTIQRRLESRIGHLRINSLSSYLKFIEKNPAEVSELFNHVLIGVTHFFRDPEAFIALEKHLRDYLAKKQDKILRIWVPGCASGEEAYTLSILLSEVLGEDIAHWNIQIFATDIDDDAISFGRRGVYPISALQLMDPGLVDKYFIPGKDGFMEANKRLRSLILFSRHDVTNNPPFLKLDLISCRNLLIYFNLELQKRVIPVFHYALENDALLFLGKSENLGVHAELFSQKNKKHKIWNRKSGSVSSAPRFRPLKPVHPSRNRSNRVSFEIKTIPERVEDTLFLNFNHPYVVVNESLEILYVAGDVSPFLQFNQGSMTTNLLKQSNSEVELILHTTVQGAIKSLESHQSQPRKLRGQDENLLFRIVCHPMLNFKDTQFLVIFESFNVDQSLLAAEQQSNQDFESIRIAELQQELDSTREHLQSYIEELETANEEMQALNEELQSTNEELQSVNEELETSNEEMQSTNEEMHIAYQELRDLHDLLKEKELEQEAQNKELNSLLNNDLQGFVLMNEDFEIKQFNVYANRTFKILQGTSLKIGSSLLKYIPKPWVSEIVGLTKQAVEEELPILKRLENLSKNEKSVFQLSINKTQLSPNNGFGYSLGIMDITASDELQKGLISLKELLDEAGSVVNMGGWTLDLKTGVTTWTKQVYEIHEVEEDYLTNLNRGLQFYPPDAQAELNRSLDEIVKEGKAFDLTLPFKTAKGRERWVRVTGNPGISNNEVVRVWGVIHDITEDYQQEQQLKDLNNDLLSSNKELEEFAYVASHDLQEPLRMVYSFIQLLEERLEGKLQGKDLQYFQFISDGARRMQNMLSDLLEYSRVNTSTDSVRLLSLKVPLEAAISNLQGQIEASNTQIIIGKLPELEIIPSQIERLFSNLIKNAIKYNENEPKIEINSHQKGRFTEILVQDNGIGIDPQYFDRIFKIFQRLHSREEYPGNGVGLAVCQRIALKHGGSLEVDSSLGKGSIFIIKLPNERAR